MAKSGRTLHVRCSTWEQVDVLLARKLRKGRFLSMKVPFDSQAGAQVTLALELPSQVALAIDGVVQRATPIAANEAGAGKSKMWIELELVGLTGDVMAKIRELASADERSAAPLAGAGAGTTEDSVSTVASIPTPAPTPAPTPIQSLRPSPKIPPAAPLPHETGELFQHFSNELRRLRTAAVHDVLGVAYDASPEEIRVAWKACVRGHHPDLVARRASPAITHLAEELTILANRAYDRLRAACVAEGRGTVVGPSLSTPPGWLVGFDDISSAPRSAPERRSGNLRVPQIIAPIAPIAAPIAVAPEIKPPPPAPSPEIKPPSSPPGSNSGGDAFERRARAMLGQGDAHAAREVLAAALVIYPRSRPLRSLYYVATALVALEAGELMLATSQLETALAHYAECAEAAQMLEHVKAGAANASDLRRLFT